jgi:hypothetical protein
MIIKAEVVRAEDKEPKDNPRFVITNMKQSPKWLYEEVYCQRGEIENRIKELHDLQIDRTSCSDFLGQPTPRVAHRRRLRSDAGVASASRAHQLCASSGLDTP